MSVRLCALWLILVVCGVIVGAKPKLDPIALMNKSDAAYYYPSGHGVNDLAVDLVIDRMANDAIMKQVQITYYYAGVDQQRFSISNYPEKFAKKRDELQSLVDPLSEYIMPRPSALTFTGFTLSVEEAFRMIAGCAGKKFYQIIGTPKGETNGVKEYRVLIDETGLAHQVENVLKDGGSIIAGIENVQIKDSWHIAKVTTRLMSSSNVQWKIDRVEYGEVEGYSLPTKLVTQYRNNYGQPVEGATDFTITLQNYRINKGVAAAVFAATKPQPATK